MEIKKISTLPKNRSILGVLLGLCAAIVIVLVLSGIFAIFLAYTPLSEGKIQGFGVLITMIALFSGGIVTAGHSGKKGLYHGLALGICFLVILWIYTAAAGEVHAGLMAIKACYILLSSAAGGIMGVKSKA